VAVISLSGIVTSESIRVAGDKMDEAIVQYVKRKYNLLIGERTAELIKISVGTAYPKRTPRPSRLKEGTWWPDSKNLEINSEKFGKLWPNRSIWSLIRSRITLEGTPPNCLQILQIRIVLVGGGALLKNLDVLLREVTGLPITIVDDPLSAIVLVQGWFWTTNATP